MSSNHQQLEKNLEIVSVFQKYNYYISSFEKEYTSKSLQSQISNLVLSIDTTDYISEIFKILKQQSDFLAELVSTFNSLSNSVPCKEEIIQTLIMSNEDSLEQLLDKKINEKKSGLRPQKILPLTISSDSFSFIQALPSVFESFGGALKNQNSNNSSFTFNNSVKNTILNSNHNTNNNIDDSIDAYIKLSNENVVGKIKTKLLEEAVPSPEKKERTDNKIINVELAEKTRNKHEKKLSEDFVKAFADTEIDIDLARSLLKDTNKYSVAGNRSGNRSGKKSKILGKYVNTRRKILKSSSLNDFHKNSKTCYDISTACDTNTNSISSKKGNRQTTVNVSRGRSIFDQTVNEYAMRRTKLFYKNIKKIKSKYNEFLNSSNVSTTKAKFLEQYINTKK